MGFFSKLFAKSEDNKNALYAPMAGQAVALSEVPDPAFSGGMLGDGIAVIPSAGEVLAPCDATVDMMFATGHAVSLVADNGAEILIHVGLDTVTLNGAPFRIMVESGQKVKKGDVLMTADLEAIKAAGLDPITPMLVCNSGDYTTFKTTAGKAVTNADVVIRLGK